MSGAVLAPMRHAEPVIPFRPEGDVPASSFASAMGLVVVLLGCAWFAAWYAKRRGWLARWVTAARNPAEGGLRLESRLRLSAKTVLYEVVDEAQRRLLVAETPAGVQVVQLQPDGKAE